MSSLHRIKRLGALCPGDCFRCLACGLRLKTTQAAGEMPLDHEKTDHSQHR